MGPVNWLAVALATLAFFAVGALWYGVLFGKVWQREVGFSDAPRGGAMARVMLGTLLAEFLIAATLGHLFARTGPSVYAIWMMSLGFALTVMTPAIAINYLHQRRSLTLFAIDAGHFVAGMAAVAAVFSALA